MTHCIVHIYLRTTRITVTFDIKDKLSIPRVRLHISVWKSLCVLVDNSSVARTTFGMVHTAFMVSLCIMCIADSQEEN